MRDPHKMADCSDLEFSEKSNMSKREGERQGPICIGANEGKCEQIKEQ